MIRKAKSTKPVQKRASHRKSPRSVSSTRKAAVSSRKWRVPEGLRISREAFLRDLPELLKRKKLQRKWVAYHGNRRIGFDTSETALYQLCYHLGLKKENFYVGLIAPHEKDPEEIDRHLWEFEEIE